MEILIVLAALLLVVIFVVVKRRSAVAKHAKSSSVKQPVVEAVASKVEVEASKPESVQSSVAAQSGKVSSVERVVALNNDSQAIRVERPVTTSSVANVAGEEKIPEDSLLRRHYLSKKQAEQESISHPYPTDSTLRRHRESLSASVLRQGIAAKPFENTEKPAKLLTLPEDATLRRHFLTQVQAEVEAELMSRPTDSALRRHYDSLVKAKMEAYLKAA